MCFYLFFLRKKRLIPDVGILLKAVEATVIIQLSDSRIPLYQTYIQNTFFLFRFVSL